MKFKSLLLAFIVGASAQAFAAEYYVTPEGAGSKDGSSWENAFGTAELIDQALNKNTDADVYNFAGGEYTPQNIIVFKKATGVTINGSADGKRTVFNASHKEGDKTVRLVALVRIQSNTAATSAAKRPVIIKNIDFINAKPTTNTEQTNDGGTLNGTRGEGALYIDNSYDVTVEGCTFSNNWAEGKLGGPAVHARRSFVKFVDCIFSGNTGVYSGGAVRLTSDNEAKGETVFDNCVFKNNKLYHDNGAAIYMQAGKSLTLINTLINGNTATVNGAAIYVGNETTKPFAYQVNIINSTIAANAINGTTVVEGSESTTVEEAEAVLNEGYQIAGAGAYKLNMVNSIVVSKDANVKDIDVAAANFTSGGYNYVGATENELTWLDTDNQAADNDFASIFGNNTLKDNKLIPYVEAAAEWGANTTQLDAATAEWGLPAGISFAGRENGGTLGAYPFTAAEIKANNQTTNAISSIGDVELRIVNHGAGLYSVEGYEGMVEVYSLSGARVMNVAAPAIDLGGFAKGVYVLRAGSATVKVVR